jgi:hypothetical protein
MTNSYHLLLKTNRPNLSKGMQWSGTTCTRSSNPGHGGILEFCSALLAGPDSGGL